MKSRAACINASRLRTTSKAAPRVDRVRERGGIEPFDDTLANHGDGHSAPTACDEFVVGAPIVIDVLRSERHAGL